MKRYLVGIVFIFVACIDITSPNWSVTGEQRIQGDLFRDEHAEIEQCTGMTRPFDVIEWFVVDSIDVGLQGVTLGLFVRPHYIFLLRGYHLDNIAKHELVHYITDLNHPEADSIIYACNAN